MAGDPQPLVTAAMLVEEYVATLDDSQEKCTCCGVIRYGNWREHNQVVELGAVAVKLRRFANQNVSA